jgi:hypothetical protein
MRPFMRTILGAIFALSVVAAACSNAASAGGGGDTLSITSPTNGAKVGQSFTVTLASNQALGDPSTGEDHVHLCFDGASCDSGSYQIVYGNTAQVAGLIPGKHTIEASLRRADHSAVGPTATITVMVGAGAGAASNGAPSLAPTSPTSSSGYSRY